MNPPAARHDRDRRGGGEEAHPRRPTRQEPAREPARQPPKQLNEYFIEGEGISREVLQIDICKHLGPEATCRPGTYNSKKGFYIKALRPFTTAQLEDLRAASEGYQAEAETLRRIGQNPRDYEYSNTRREFNQDMPLSDPYYSSSVYPQGGPSYPPGSSFPPVSGPGYPSVTYTQNPSYLAYSMASGPGAMPAPMYPNMPNEDPRYGSNYTYAQTNPTYAQDRYLQYASDPRYEAQQPPRGYGQSAQDPTGRAMERPQYYDSQPSLLPYNSNPGAQYPRPGPSTYEAPQNRDPYRQGPPQNQYDRQRQR